MARRLEIVKRHSALQVFFQAPVMGELARGFDQSLESLNLQRKVMRGVTTYRTSDGLAGVAIGERFVQMRSARLADGEVAHDLSQLSAYLLDEQSAKPEGVTSRLAAVVRYGDADDLAHLLRERYLGFLANPAVDGAPIDAASMKFYFRRDEVPYELDVGPALSDPNGVYVELEARRRGPMLSRDFATSWQQDSQIFAGVLETFVPLLIFGSGV